jgi:hypothetical protein
MHQCALYNPKYGIVLVSLHNFFRVCRGHDRMVVGFTTTYAWTFSHKAFKHFDCEGSIHVVLHHAKIV